MSTETRYRAKYDFVASGKGMLTIKVGDRFTLVSKTNDDWLTVKSAAGDMGLAPASYLEAVQETEDSKGPSYTAIYDFTGQDGSQLTFKRGETLSLVSKSDVSWWLMSNSAGEEGLVPVNYIDKLEEVDGVKEGTVGEGGAQNDVRVNGGDDEALAEVLMSIDRAIQKIHDESVLQGGMYTAEQKVALKSLTLHRKSVIEENATLNHIDSSPTKSLGPITTTPNGSPRLSTKSSPSRARRQAPPPPTQAGAKSGSAISSNHTEQSSNKESSTKKRKGDNRLSLQSDSVNSVGDPRPRFGSLPRRTAPSAPSKESHSTLPSGKPPKHPGSSSRSSIPGDASSFTTFSTFKSSPQSSHSQLLKASSSPLGTRRYSADTAYTQSQKQKQTNLSASSPEGLPIRRTHSQASSIDYQRGGGVSSSSPPRTMSSSAENSPRPPRKHASASVSPSSSPRPQRASEGEVFLRVPQIELPTSFSCSAGTELVENVRSRTGMSYHKSLLAVGEVLSFLKTKVPTCTDMVDSLLSAVHKSQVAASPSAVRKMNSSKDRERLREIFFQLQECKDDSQQRGWAVHDDQHAIMEYLEELLQILCDANPDITKVAIQEDKYENILTLITYYQMESRVPIRLLLLKVFGVLCGLDKTVVNVLLSSVLPNELGRDIQQNLTSDIQKTLYSSTVCTMVFSTAEAVPLPVYDQWSEEYVLFLLDTVERPPEEDVEEQIPDAFVNIILSFNQHFQDPSTNLVMSALKERPNPRNFSEKLMYLVNREEDPVAISEPCCPNSLTKFLLDVFSDASTSGMFYTTDMMVLIDIVTRQLSDLGPGEETRTHYLELLCRIVTNTDYKEHRHRRQDISTCLNRIAQEENPESERDHEVIKKLWVTFPGIFEEVTDL